MDLEVEVNNLEPMLVKNPVRPYPFGFPEPNCFPFPGSYPGKRFAVHIAFHSVHIVDGEIDRKNFTVGKYRYNLRSTLCIENPEICP
jgi:hypothetical protein